MKKMIGILLVFALITAPAIGFAGSVWTEEPYYDSQVRQKFIFGLKNTLLGWTELITETGEEIGETEGFWNEAHNTRVSPGELDR